MLEIKLGASGNYDRTKLNPKEKIDKLNSRRIPSVESLLKTHIAKFRDQKQGARLKHLEHDVEYSIGHTSSFLLGRIQQHNYKPLLDEAKKFSGFNDKELAHILIRGLTGELKLNEEVDETARSH